MSLYDPVTPERLGLFLTRLSRAYHDEGTVYLVGGTGLLYQHLKSLTKDVDLATRMPPAAEARFSTVVRRLGREMNMAIEEVSPADFIWCRHGHPCTGHNMAIEEVSPADFIPLPAGAEERHRYLGRQGSLEIYAYDPVSTALAKIARGRLDDYADITALVDAGQLSAVELTGALEEILPRVAAGDATKITPDAFRAHMAAFLSFLPEHRSVVTPLLEPDDALMTELRQYALDLRVARPEMTIRQIDEASLRAVAIAHPEATTHVLRETFLDGSLMLDQGTVVDADRYVDVVVTHALLDIDVRQARTMYQRDHGGSHGL